MSDHTGGELTAAQIEQGWRDTFSVENPYCPCDLKSFTKAVRWAQRQAALLAPASAPATVNAADERSSPGYGTARLPWDRPAAPQDGEASE